LTISALAVFAAVCNPESDAEEITSLLPVVKPWADFVTVTVVVVRL
jgi:hypothetical protein